MQATRITDRRQRLSNVLANQLEDTRLFGAVHQIGKFTVRRGTPANGERYALNVYLTLDPLTVLFTGDQERVTEYLMDKVVADE